MATPRPRPRYRCRFCGVVLSAWLAVPGEPDGALRAGVRAARRHHQAARGASAAGVSGATITSTPIGRQICRSCLPMVMLRLTNLAKVSVTYMAG
jgi:hypothetical protein